VPCASAQTSASAWKTLHNFISSTTERIDAPAEVARGISFVRGPKAQALVGATLAAVRTSSSTSTPTRLRVALGKFRLPDELEDVMGLLLCRLDRDAIADLLQITLSCLNHRINALGHRLAHDGTTLDEAAARIVLSLADSGGLREEG
jgi:hypothetical protein